MATQDISQLQIKVTSNGITDATTKLNKLTDAAVKTENAVKSLATSVITSNSSMLGATGATVALTNAILTLNNTLSSQTVRTVESSGAIRQHSASMRDAHDAARGLAGSLGMLWVTYGNMLPLAAGLATGAALKGIMSSGVEVEHAIESMRVKGDQTAESADKLRESILSIGQGVYGPKEVAGALDALILAGLNAKEAITAVKASLNLATAGGSTIEKAAESLVTIGTAVGATASQYDMVADGITKAANTSLASVDSIAEAVKRASVVNKLYGASFEDILTQAAALSQLGIKNSAAGTAITNFYGDAMGKTEKAKKALAELGMSFFDADGKAKPLVASMEELNTKLNKFNEGKQGHLMEDLFGERAKRDVVGVLDLVRTGASDADKYANKLREISGEINNMAGTASLAAAQLAMTTENQMKSVQNTLQTTFVKVFKDIEPQVNLVTAKLKSAFGSPEFANALSTIATAVVNLTVALIDNAGWISAVVEGILVFKAATVGGAIFSSLVPVLGGLASMFGVTAASITGATMAMGALRFAMLALPFVGVVIGIGTAIAALASLGKKHEDTADSSKKLADAYNTNYLQALDDEADRLVKTNDLAMKGLTIREAEIKATKTLAYEKALANNKDVVSKAKAEVTGLIDTTNNKANGPWTRQAAFDKIPAAKKALAEAEKELQNFEADAAAATSIIEVAAETQRQLYKQDEEARDKKLKAAAGVIGSTEEESKAAKKAREFYEGERLELERLIATYEARTAAVLAGAAAEQRVRANVEQGRVKANGVGKYPSQKAYNDELALAKKADDAKYDQQNANAIVEQQNKVTDILQREVGYKLSINDAEKERMGLLEKQTVAIMRFNHASADDLAAAKLRAADADKILRLEDARKKLETSTGQANSRAQGYIDEADAIAAYGDSAKQTAVEAARLELVKLRLNVLNAGSQIQARLDAAAMQDLGKSYLELAKQQAALAAQEEVNNVAGATGVIGSETAKVEAKRRTTEMALQFDLDRAASALKVAEASKDPEVVAGAKKTYADVLKMSDKVSKQLKKNFTIDFKVAGLKDISSELGRLGKAATSMGESFAHVGTAISGLGDAFSSLADIQAATGISEEERQERQIGAYGDMAEASAGFFQENSKGYKIMMGVSKVFHALEMAQSMMRLGQLAIEAVMNQAKGDPYSAFARMAAMAAVVAALGYAVSGGFSSNTSTGTAEQVQKTQGTGTVLGDSTAKSESITNALELMKDNSSVLLPLTQGMYRSLLAIQDSMSGLASLVAQSAGITDGSNMNIKTGVLDKTLGGLWGKTTQSIIDSGLMYGGNVAALQRGSGYSQYANVEKTSSSWFGLKKNTSSNVQTQGVDSDVAQQFGLIFTNLETSLKGAASTLGKDGDAVGAAIENMVIDTTKVSLKGLTGSDLTDAINNVLSATMDEIAQQAFPSMTAFRQVGEGYAETVLRVATGIDKAQGALELLGIKAIDYTNIVDKQGDVAFEIAQQSIAASEGMSGINDMLKNMSGTVDDLIDQYKALTAIRKSMNGVGLNGNGLNVNVVKGAGSVSALSSALANYQEAYFTEQEKSAIMLKSVAAEFSKLNVAMPANKAALRALIEQTGVGTEESAKLTGQLLVLADAYDQASQAADDARKTQIDGINDTIDSLKEFADTLKSFREGLMLGDLSTLTPEEKFAEAKAQYESTLALANAGDSTAQGKITDAAQAFLEASRVINASGEGYGLTFDQVQRDMSNLEALTEGQISEAEKQLALLQDQADSLSSLNDTADAIRESVDALAAATPITTAPVVVDTTALQGEITELRKQLAEAQAANAAQMDALMEVVYNSQVDGSTKVAEAVTTAAQDTSWIAQTTNTVSKER